MEEKFMQAAIELSEYAVREGHGGPFGCVVVKDGQIVGRGWNTVLRDNDPTAHAEIMAIRDACAQLGSHQLQGCDIYTSCEPCPMCMGAVYWARPARLYYANNRKDAAAIGFDDSFIYEEINISDDKKHIPFQEYPNSRAAEIFKNWANKNPKPEY
jgi:guanine deaminase